MIINLPNKSKIDNEQKELQNMSLLKFIFKGKSVLFDDEILIILLYSISFTISLPLVFSLFIIDDIKYAIVISFVFFILLIIVIIKLEYNTKTSDKLNSKKTQKLQEKLNEKYVSQNDHEKVYLLHELITKYNLEYSSVDQSDDYSLKLELNTNKFIKFKHELYKDEDVYHELKNNVLNDQMLSEEEAQKFYYEYINHKIKPKQKRIKSLDEHNALSQRLKNKNQRY